MKKRILSFLISTTLCLSSFVTAFANISNDELKNIASDFLSVHYGHSINLDNGIDLYGEAHEIIARCYQVDEGGYIIISTDDQQIVEFSLTENIKGHPTYNNHWVTGYGYSDNFAIVNNGWGSNGIYINLSYGTSLVYITNV